MVGCQENFAEGTRFPRTTFGSAAELISLFKDLPHASATREDTFNLVSYLPKSCAGIFGHLASASVLDYASGLYCLLCIARKRDMSGRWNLIPLG